MHLPSNLVGYIFGAALLLVIAVTVSFPQLYKAQTEPAFDDAFFVNSYKDRILNYGTHPQLGEITVNGGSYPIVTSRASRRVDEIITIFNDGVRGTITTGLISSLLCGVVISLVLIRANSTNKLNAVTGMIVAGITLALIFFNYTSVLLRSSSDIKEYNVSQPLIGGSMALLTFSSIEQNASELFTEAIERGAPRDAMDAEQSTFAHHAAKFGRLSALQKLAEFPDVQFDLINLSGQTPVQIAVGKSYTDVVQLLLDQGADPNNPDDAGRTLLHLAAANNDVEMLELLLQHTKGLNVFDDSVATPLALAAENLDFSTVSLLLENDADVNALMDDYTTFFELTLNEILKLVQGHVPFTNDEQQNLLSLVQRMIEKGADLSRQDQEGNTDLHRISLTQERFIDEGLQEAAMLRALMRILIEGGANTGTRNVEKRNALPLSLVIRLGYEQWLDRAIADNEDRLNAYEIEGVSLFQYAVEHSKADTLKLLLANGMTTKPWVPADDDPLRPLILRNDLETAQILLEQGYVKSENAAVNQDGPMHLAARNDLAEMIELLIEYGYKVDAQGYRGNTPLHYAISTRSLISMLTLVENKADPLIWNNDGVTPQMMTRSMNVRAINDLMKRAIKERDPRRPTPEPPADVEVDPTALPAEKESE